MDSLRMDSRASAASQHRPAFAAPSHESSPMNIQVRDLIPTLLMTGGLLAGTLVSVLTRESGLLTLLGPLIMASTMVIASRISTRQGVTPQNGTAVALILGGSLLFASLIVAVSDPSRVAILMPILGGGFVVLLGPRKCRRQRETLGDTADA